MATTIGIVDRLVFLGHQKTHNSQTWKPHRHSFCAPYTISLQTMKLKCKNNRGFLVCKATRIQHEEKWDFLDLRHMNINKIVRSLDTKYLKKDGIMGSIVKPVIVGVMVVLLTIGGTSTAIAASGGRMGGSSFSSSSSSQTSYTSSNTDYQSSYSGGGGSWVEDPSPTYYTSTSTAFTYSRPVYDIGYGESSGFTLIVIAILAGFFIFSFLPERSDRGRLSSTQRTSVIKLQVGLLGLARSLQKDLNWIAETADTSTPKGLNYILKETVLALLRHPDFCISGYSLVDIKTSVEAGEKRFNQFSIEERGKFDEETLVNVDSMRKQSSMSSRSEALNNEYIVVTILAAIQGEYKLPIINSNADLKKALEKLGSIPPRQTLAVEVLWTPQNEGDSLSERELLQDYPLLRPL